MEEADSKLSSTGRRADTYKLIGGKIQHICVYDSEEIGKGVSICIEKDGKESTFHVYLPRDIEDVYEYLKIDYWN